MQQQEIVRQLCLAFILRQLTLDCVDEFQIRGAARLREIGTAAEEQRFFLADEQAEFGMKHATSRHTHR